MTTSHSNLWLIVRSRKQMSCSMLMQGVSIVKMYANLLSMQIVTGT